MGHVTLFTLWPRKCHFDHFIGKIITTSGLMISLVRNKYFWNQCFLWGITRDINHSFTEKVPWGYRKIFVILLSRDPWYEKSNKNCCVTSARMKGFVLKKTWKNSHKDFRLVIGQSIRTYGQFPDVLIYPSVPKFRTPKN